MESLNKTENQKGFNKPKIEEEKKISDFCSEDFEEGESEDSIYSREK
jgi:hypothetical protein